MLVSSSMSFPTLSNVKDIHNHFTPVIVNPALSVSEGRSYWAKLESISLPCCLLCWTIHEKELKKKVLTSKSQSSHVTDYAMALTGCYPVNRPIKSMWNTAACVTTDYMCSYMTKRKAVASPLLPEELHCSGLPSLLCDILRSSSRFSLYRRKTGF